MMKKIFAFTIVLIILDQITKHWAQQMSGDLQIASWFHIQYSQNPGIAFGIAIPQPLVFLATLLILPLLYKTAKESFKMDHPLTISSLTLIFSGAIGNLIDRITQGFVTDFIAIGPWPNFNLADSYIVAGVLLIIVFYSKIHRNQQQKT